MVELWGISHLIFIDRLIDRLNGLKTIHTPAQILISDELKLWANSTSEQAQNLGYSNT
jgi:hypothetical protein